MIEIQLNATGFNAKSYVLRPYRNGQCYYITEANGAVRRVRNTDYFAIKSDSGTWVTLQEQNRLKHLI